MASIRRSLEMAVPFSDCQLQRISETGELRNLNLKLAYFLACEFSHLLAWSTTTISYPQNRSELPQSEAGSERIANEVYAIHCVSRVGPIPAVCSWRLL